MSQYSDIRRIWGDYWRIYGGSKAFFGSPYLHLSLALSLPTYHLWANTDWWDIVIGTMPTMIGFSLAGLAVFLGLGDESFKKALTGPLENKTSSPFLSLVVAFVHYIVFQTVALIYAILAKALSNLDRCMLGEIAKYTDWFPAPTGWLGFTLFLYAILMTLAATFNVLRLSKWFDLHNSKEKNNPADK